MSSAVTPISATVTVVSKGWNQLRVARTTRGPAAVTGSTNFPWASERMGVAAPASAPLAPPPASMAAPTTGVPARSRTVPATLRWAPPVSAAPPSAAAGGPSVPPSGPPELLEHPAPAATVTATANQSMLCVESFAVCHCIRFDRP
jgi:hypothetical protein